MARRDSTTKKPPTHTEIAAELGVDRTVITKALSGTRKPKLSVALGIFRLSGKRVGDLLGKSDAEIKTLEAANVLLERAA